MSQPIDTARLRELAEKARDQIPVPHGPLTLNGRVVFLSPDVVVALLDVVDAAREYRDEYRLADAAWREGFGDMAGHDEAVTQKSEALDESLSTLDSTPKEVK